MTLPNKILNIQWLDISIRHCIHVLVFQLWSLRTWYLREKKQNCNAIRTSTWIRISMFTFTLLRSRVSTRLIESRWRSNIVIFQTDILAGTCFYYIMAQEIKWKMNRSIEWILVTQPLDPNTHRSPTLTTPRLPSTTP